MDRNASADSHGRSWCSLKKLIEAVVASVDSDGKPPAILRLSWMSGKYGSLPNVGGVLDQEYAMMHQMGVVSTVYDTLTRFRSFKGEQIHGMSSSERRLIKSLRDMDLI